MSGKARTPRPMNMRWVVRVLITLILCFAAGAFASNAIFRLTGRPGDVWATVISGFVSLVILWAVSWIMMRVIGHSNRRRDYGALHEAIEALNQIAHGDFSVLVPVGEHDPFSELAESVNKMARELGTMESLRQDFISNVSHEIQSPLTSITGFAALLRNKALPDELRAHYLDVIEAEAKRLSKLSENLLRLSSLEHGAQPLSIAPFALDRQIQSVVLMLEPQWTEKNLDLSLSLQKFAFEGDEALLSQVWVNLIQNAVKFTPDGGSINISLTRSEGKAVFRVADTGLGISEEDQLRIFERFYKADKARDRSLGGNGLGLSIVKKIVALHGGAIRVDSQVGAGSIFTVSLPTKQ